MAEMSIINVANWLPPLVVDKNILEKPALDIKISFTLPPALEKLAKDVKEKWIKEWKAAFDPKFDADFWKMSNDMFAKIQAAVTDIEKKFKARARDADYEKLVEGANVMLKNAVLTWRDLTVKKCEEIGKKAAETACKITKQVLGLIWQGAKWLVSLTLRAGIRLAQGALKIIALPVDLVTGGAASAAINAAANLATKKIQQYIGSSFPTLSNTLSECAAVVRTITKETDPRVGKLDDMAKTLQLHLEMQSKNFVSLSMALDDMIKANPKAENSKAGLKTKAEIARLDESNKKISETLAAVRKLSSVYAAWKANEAAALIASATAARSVFDAGAAGLTSALGNLLAKTA